MGAASEKVLFSLLNGQIEWLTKGRGTPISPTSQLVHPDLSLPVRRIRLLATCTTFQQNPTLASSLYTISSAVDVNHFRFCVNAINGASPDITDSNIADLSSLAAEFGFPQLLHEI
jgi:hypothetical protein